MRRTALALVAILSQALGAAAAQDLTLSLPHPLRPGETVWIKVEIGRIGPGREVDVTTATGQELGVISPYGAPAGRRAGTYALPIPTDAVRDGGVSIRLLITQVGAPPRPPTGQEVRRAQIVIARAAP
jgi:hypothetical protein